MASDLKLYNPDAAETVDSPEDISKLGRLRARCLSAMRAAVSSSPNVLGNEDVRQYERNVISDEAFAAGGAHDIKTKIQWLTENINVNIPKLVSDSRALEAKFKAKIEEAKSKGWINQKSANDWTRRLKDGNVYYWQKKKFIEDPAKFSKYFENWKKVAEARDALLKNSNIKSIKSSDVPQINVFLNQSQFLNLSFEARQSLLSTVKAALAAKEKHVPKLFAQAKAMLEGAASKQAISWNKVGSWLERIFRSDADPQKIEDFLNNKGSWPLQKLIDNWSRASKHYQQIEAKRKSLGTPPGFHFVSMGVFLNWQYDKRTSYLEEAEHRFTDINKEPSLFTRIRHELGSKDWDAAEDLIADAKREEWGNENQRKLQTMEQFLKYHRSTAEKDPKQKGQNETPDPKQILAEMRSLVGELPPQLQAMYVRALNRGYQNFWVLTTLMYNRVWCHQHNFLDPKKEQKMQTEAKDPTRERLVKGHKRYGLEVNDIRGDTNERAAVRDQDGVRGAQILLTDERSDGTLDEEIHEQKNDRNFWYWTSMIPQGVSYAEHLNVVQTLHPKMKKLARKMHELGVVYSSSGAPSTEQKKAA